LGPSTPANDTPLLVMTDLDTGVSAQLVGNRLIPVSLHLALIDRQDGTIVSNRDDVAFLHPLFDVRTRESNPLVIRIVGLRLLFDHWPISHGGAQRERANHCTKY
jgi:hypothetical protein